MMITTIITTMDILMTTAMDIPAARYRNWASLGIQRKAFVGGAGDGRSGATAMDYHIVGAPEADDAPRSSLTARKAWFFPTMTKSSL